jgi:hypothetical protein
MSVFVNIRVPEDQGCWHHQTEENPGGLTARASGAEIPDCK